jgi:hypothetical protein
VSEKRAGRHYTPFGAVKRPNPAEIRQTTPRKKSDRCPSSGSRAKAAEQTVVRSISRKREQIATLREELEDLNDYLDLTEARVRDAGKPRLTHAEVKKRCGLK